MLDIRFWLAGETQFWIAIAGVFFTLVFAIKKNYPFKVPFIGILCIVIFVLVFNFYNMGNNVRMPNLKELTFADAKVRLNELDLKYETSCAGVKFDYVIDQDKKEDTVQKKGNNSVVSNYI